MGFKKDSLHKHPSLLPVQSVNLNEQTAVYGSSILFMAWLFGDILFGLGLVVSVVVFAHGTALLSKFREQKAVRVAETFPRDKTKNPIIFETPLDAGEAEQKSLRGEVNPSEILKGL